MQAPGSQAEAGAPPTPRRRPPTWSALQAAGTAGRRTADAGDDAQAGLGEAQARAARHHAHVRAERQLQAAAERRAVHGGHDRHRQRGQGGDDAAHRVAEAQDVGRRLRGALLQVGARAKGTCAAAAHAE